VGAVIAIERDERLAGELQEALSERGEKGKGELSALPPFIIRGDALKLDWHRLLHEAPLPGSRLPMPTFKVIGNIPYYITSPLIDKALEPPRPEVTVFLIQREVADRLVAEPGSKAYGAITIGVRVVSRVERLFNVKPGSFQPPPNVDSAVVRMVPLDRPLVSDDDLADFRRFVSVLFSQRRKQLVRSLRRQLSDDRAQVEAVLDSLDIHPTSRPEVLSPAEFVRLFHALSR